MFTKWLVFASKICNDVTLREKEFKAIQKRFPGQSIVTKWLYQDMVKTLNGILYPEIYTEYQVQQQF